MFSAFTVSYVRGQALMKDIFWGLNSIDYGYSIHEVSSVDSTYLHIHFALYKSLHHNDLLENFCKKLKVRCDLSHKHRIGIHVTVSNENIQHNRFSPQYTTIFLPYKTSITWSYLYTKQYQILFTFYLLLKFLTA